MLCYISLARDPNSAIVIMSMVCRDLGNIYPISPLSELHFELFPVLFTNCRIPDYHTRSTDQSFTYCSSTKAVNYINPLHITSYTTSFGPLGDGYCLLTSYIIKYFNMCDFIVTDNTSKAFKY